MDWFHVMVRDQINGKVWRTTEREFGSEDAANEWAQAMYDQHDPRKGEVTVTIFKLVKIIH